MKTVTNLIFELVFRNTQKQHRLCFKHKYTHTFKDDNNSINTKKKRFMSESCNLFKSLFDRMLNG